MKHYVSPDGQLFAYERDGSQDALIPKNFRPVSDAEAEAIRAPKPTVEYLSAKVQGLLDSQVRKYGYDNIVTLASYAQSKSPKFAKEAAAGIVWRDKVWQFVFSIFQEVEAGTRTLPTWAELRVALPVLVWP